MCAELLGGSIGRNIFQYARGVDKRTIDIDVVRKSVGCDINYGIRLENRAQVAALVHAEARYVTGLVAC